MLELKKDAKDAVESDWGYSFLKNLIDSAKYKNRFRPLTNEEIVCLEKNGNQAQNWQHIFVSDPFNAALVRNCEFFGAVYIGALQEGFLEHEGLQLPLGLYNSAFSFSVIGDNTSLRNVRYLSHYIIGDRCLLFNIGQMTVTAAAKFGHGFIKADEDKAQRIWLETVNEMGGRNMLAFKDILPADGYFWTHFRQDEALQQRFVEMTDALYLPQEFTFGRIGEQSALTDTRIIKNVHIGPQAVVKGANKLENLTIQSSRAEPTHIGAGVELVDGIVGFQNRIEYDVKAIRFITGRNVHLEYGARFINSFVGPNSTIACCEVLSNLIFPFHEQHHNNSFLIATTVMGQSNIAAGATIGSNHNSRAADGEIFARRGFWPGLVTNFKHNSAFASFTLIAKGNYYAEMNITLPFCLISPSADPKIVQLFPGYWFKYNMYALARNAWKFHKRDKRKIKAQHIETDFMAPDTIEEIFNAIEALHAAINKETGEFHSLNAIEQRAAELDKGLHLELPNQINKGRALILKPAQGITLYRMVIKFYAGRALSELIVRFENEGKSLQESLEAIRQDYRPAERNWENAGGQLMSVNDRNALFEDIKNGSIDSWNTLHKHYDRLWEAYPQQKQWHGIDSLLRLFSMNIDGLDADFVKNFLTEIKRIALQFLDWAFESRQKDYTNPFRLITYRNAQELEKVTGKIEDNSFLNDYKESMTLLARTIDKLI